MDLDGIGPDPAKNGQEMQWDNTFLDGNGSSENSRVGVSISTFFTARDAFIVWMETE
jgi:hypothetical protein